MSDWHDQGNVETGRTVCPCGVDHPDPETGATGEEKRRMWAKPGYWTPIGDPKAQAALDDLVLEAWLGEDDDVLE